MFDAVVFCLFIDKKISLQDQMVNPQNNFWLRLPSQIDIDENQTLSFSDQSLLNGWLGQD